MKMLSAVRGRHVPFAKSLSNLRMRVTSRKAKTTSTSTACKDEKTEEPPEESKQADRPKPDPNRKGAYWNYETNRWSYCEDSSDDEAPAPATAKADTSGNV